MLFVPETPECNAEHDSSLPFACVGVSLLIEVILSGCGRSAVVKMKFRQKSRKCRPTESCDIQTALIVETCFYAL